MRTAFGIGVIAALACVPGYAQEFEVASVKPSTVQEPPMMHGGPGTDDPGQFTYTNASLFSLLFTAFDVRRNQLVGLQDWMEHDRFDIAAKLPADATKQQMHVMLQNLLASRFHLVTHRETKEMSIYALIVAKGGPKLKLAQDAPPPDSRKTGLEPDGCPARLSSASSPKGLGIVLNGRVCVVATSWPISWLTDFLASVLDRTVEDMTGFSGEYAFRLSFDPGNTTPVAEPNPDAVPDVFAALQQQLGLRLESRKGPVEMLVIDHLEKTPTEN